MRHCPKCRSFYDDEQLRFCLRDGVPLTDVNQSDEIWNEGTDFIRDAQRRVVRQIRVQRLKKIVSMVITTVLVIMVVSVITLNSWIYLAEPEKEIVQNVIPSTARSPESSPVPSPEMSPDATPSPEPTPTSSSTPTPTRTRTPTPTPTPTETPTPDTCTTERKRMLQERIEAEKAGTWREQFAKGKDEFITSNRPQIMSMCERRIRNSQTCAAMAARVDARLTEAPLSKSVVTEDCKTVTATVTFAWMIVSPVFQQFSLPQTRSFPYPVK